jgi:2-oxo-4-hydroxy-4-carboxy-5-ureidoimidazoline decarboxylase
LSKVLGRWNQMPPAEAEDEVFPCCGSRAWSRGITDRRPIADESALLAASDEVWRALTEEDWMEAFRSHPRIGESAEKREQNRSARWSAQEQNGAAAPDPGSKRALAAANREYEKRFGHIFIVCATGRSAADIMGILRLRLQNDPGTELREAAEQQRQITRLRLKRWLTE